VSYTVYSAVLELCVCVCVCVSDKERTEVNQNLVEAGGESVFVSAACACKLCVGGGGNFQHAVRFG